MIDSYVKDVTVQNTPSLIFENSVISQSNIENCEEVYITDCVHDKAVSDLVLMNTRYYSNTNGDVIRNK